MSEETWPREWLEEIRAEAAWQKTNEGHPDLDECYCGDYRYQHEDGGKGACKLNGLGHHGAPACHKFKLSRASQKQEGRG